MKVLRDTRNNVVFVEGFEYQPVAIGQKGLCECCDIHNTFGPCKTEDKMAVICTATEYRFKTPVVWKQTSLGQPVGTAVAEQLLQNIEDMLPEFTDEMLTDFCVRMKGGIDHLNRTGSCFDERVPI